MYSVKALLKLKSEKLTYINKSYTRERFITPDKKYYFIRDGIDYVKIYVATEAGTGSILYAAYHQNDYNGYPIYTIEDAIDKINELNIQPEYILNIDISHFL